MNRRVAHRRGSNNIFADIGIANPEEALAKAQVAREINRLISERHLTQIEAAQALGVDQPRISFLATGRLSVFSLEKLMDFAARLGNAVEISITPTAGVGCVRVKPVRTGTWNPISAYDFSMAATRISSAYFSVDVSTIATIAWEEETFIPEPWLAEKLSQEEASLYVTL